MIATLPRDFRFKKSLGQNLLLDDNINRIMVDAAGLTPATDVVEVGAGLGALTTRLIDRAGRVLSVEIDPAFIPLLQDRFSAATNLKLFRGDILNHELDKLVEEYLPGAKSTTMVSNLPYYITTPILFLFWESPLRVDRMVVMVQEEVGHRLTSRPGDHDYGVLSLAAAYHGEVDIVHKVPATCFKPRPKVDSCIVRMRTRATPLYPDVDGQFLSEVIRKAFSQRRKTLRNTLAKSAPFGVTAEDTIAIMNHLEIDPGRRPQTLSLDEFAAIARGLSTKSLQPNPSLRGRAP